MSKISFAPSIQMKISPCWVSPNLIFLLVLVLVVGCGQNTGGSPPDTVYRKETVVLPTGAPTSKPTPVSTRVIPVTVFTPGPTSTITPIPDEVFGLVVEVADGDTIGVILEGDPPTQTYQVRYLGIDAPPNAAGEPWGVVAFEVNHRLTSGKVVRLERDQSDTDADGRLLRYVYVGDEMLSVILAEQGLARASVEEPDTRFQTEILEVEKRARDNKLGLWGPLPTATPTVSRAETAVITPTVRITTTATIKPEATGTVEPEAIEEQTPLGSPTAPKISTSEVGPEAPVATETPAAISEPTVESTPSGSLD